MLNVLNKIWPRTERDGEVVRAGWSNFTYSNSGTGADNVSKNISESVSWLEADSVSNGISLSSTAHSMNALQVRCRRKKPTCGCSKEENV